MVRYTPARTILLTGAGFTQSFGGRLASDMWEAIFNQSDIQDRPRLRNRMLEEMNYEAFYSEVMTRPEYEPDERDAVLAAVKRTYAQMHRVLCQEQPDYRAKAAAVGHRIIARLEGRKRERGFFFTLNQDLFIEKHFGSQSRLLEIPGLSHPQWFNGQLPPELGATHSIRLPDQERVEKLKAQFEAEGAPHFVYLKLHGSFTWTGIDGSDAMVIGHTKTEMIAREPLLRWYLELFKDTLRQPQRRLVIIGYGFRDPHINDIIADGIKESGLRLVVISPLNAVEFRNHMDPIHGLGDPPNRGGEIWRGLRHYETGTATDLYHPTAAGLPERGRAFFDNLELN